MCIITLDAHARDIVIKMAEEKVESASHFSWLSQIKVLWDTGKKEASARIMDATYVSPPSLFAP